MKIHKLSKIKLQNMQDFWAGFCRPTWTQTDMKHSFLGLPKSPLAGLVICLIRSQAIRGPQPQTCNKVFATCAQSISGSIACFRFRIFGTHLDYGVD